MAIDLTVNGHPASTDAPPAASLSWVHHAGAAETRAQPNLVCVRGFYTRARETGVGVIP